MMQLDDLVSQATAMPVAPPLAMGELRNLARRQTRRKVASTVVVLVLSVVTIGIVFATTSSRSASRSIVATPGPTKTSAPATTQTNGGDSSKAAVDPASRVGMCIGSLQSSAADPSTGPHGETGVSPPEGTLSVLDFAIGSSIDMPISQYCEEQDAALIAAGFPWPKDATPGSRFEVWNGHVKLVLPDGTQFG
jgi:hypothetical protein